MLRATIESMKKYEFGDSRFIIAEVKIRAPFCNENLEFSEKPEDKERWQKHLKEVNEFYHLNPYSLLEIHDTDL